MALVALDCVIIGNEARANEYLCGGFLCGVDNLRVTNDLSINAIVFKNFDVTITRVGVVTTGVVKTASLAASVAGVGAVSAQQDPNRNFAAVVARQGAIVAHASGIVTPSISIAGVSGLSVQQALTRGFNVSVSGVSAVTAQVSSVISFTSPILGAGQIVVQEAPLRGLSASVAGNATVSTGLTVLTLVTLQANVTRAAVVSIPTLGKIVDLACEIGKAPLCGEHICGTFVCDSGCYAAIVVDLSRSPLVFGVAIAGQATVLPPLLFFTRYLAIAIQGKATVIAAIHLALLWPVDCVDIDLDEPTCVDELPDSSDALDIVLAPSPAGDLVLVGSVAADIDLDESECR